MVGTQCQRLGSCNTPSHWTDSSVSIVHSSHVSPLRFSQTDVSRLRICDGVWWEFLPGGTVTEPEPSSLRRSFDLNRNRRTHEIRYFLMLRRSPDRLFLTKLVDR